MILNSIDPFVLIQPSTGSERLQWQCSWCCASQQVVYITTSTTIFMKNSVSVESRYLQMEHMDTFRLAEVVCRTPGMTLNKSESNREQKQPSQMYNIQDLFLMVANEGQHDDWDLEHERWNLLQN